MRHFITAAAVIGFSLAIVATTEAANRGNTNRNGSNPPSNHNSFNKFSFSSHFDYGRHGLKTLDYSHRFWNEHYGCYLYYGCSNWYFYVPAYSCYVPYEYITTVFEPVAVTVVAPTVIYRPLVTSVVPVAPVVPSVPVAPAPSVPVVPR